MNSFGKIFRVTIFGESHGPVVGVTVDGVTPGIPLSEKDFEADILRRKPGAPGTTPRIEADIPEFLSGIYEGHTTGAPLTIVFSNGNTRPQDYEGLKPRPGHADITAAAKFSSFNDPRGGGHFSGRLTLPLVAAGVVAKKMLPSVAFEADLIEIGSISDRTLWPAAIEKAKSEGGALGGSVRCCVDGISIGLGEPFWDSAESLLSHAVFSIPGVRAISFGGGINGGITNGSSVRFTVEFKAPSSTPKAGVEGRHDVCFALRTPVIVEAVAAIVFADLFRIQAGLLPKE